VCVALYVVDGAREGRQQGIHVSGGQRSCKGGAFKPAVSHSRRPTTTC
jgi:hypothetical protein